MKSPGPFRCNVKVTKKCQHLSNSNGLTAISCANADPEIEAAMTVHNKIRFIFLLRRFMILFINDNVVFVPLFYVSSFVQKRFYCVRIVGQILLPISKDYFY